ncbi:MAG: glycosyltransferase family 4 protein [Bacteroidota bacterium]
MGSAGQWTVLQSCSSPSWGGLEMQTLQECAELGKESHRVILICHPNSRLELEAQSQNIQTIPIVLRDFPEPLGILKVRNIITGHDIEIVHAQLSKDLWTLVPAVKLSRKAIPILLTKRVGSYIPKRDPFHRWIYNNVDRAIAISTVIKRNLLETCPLSDQKVEVLHDGVDIDVFSAARVSPEPIRKEFKIRSDHILLGMVGRFSPGKGHEDFLEAMTILRAKFPKVRALIVGEASLGEHAYEAQIQQRAKESGLDRLVTFTGFRRDIPAIMASFDIFVFPSHAEAFGDVVIEAMAMGKPVVSSNCDGVADIVLHGQTGLQVPPGSPEALANAIESLIEDEPRRRELGIGSVQRARECFSLRRRTARLTSAYTDLLRKKRRC